MSEELQTEVSPDIVPPDDTGATGDGSMLSEYSPLRHILRNETLWVSCIAFLFLTVMVARETSRVGSLERLVYWDAWNYLMALKAWKAGALGPDTYHHGLGMGALGYFTSIAGNPFILWSYVFFLIVSICLWKLFRRILSPFWSLVAFMITTLTFPVTSYYVISYNNMTTWSLTLYALLLAVDRKPVDFKRGAGLGLLYGICFACRYLDPLLMSPLVLYLLFRDIKTDPKTCVKGWAGFAIFALPWLFFTLYVHHTYLGGVMHSPYDAKIPYVDRVEPGTVRGTGHAKAQFLNDLFRNLYQVLVWPQAYARPRDIAGHKSLMQTMPFLLLAFPGLWYWFKERKGRRAVIYVVLASVAFCALLYGTCWAYTAHDLKYGCLRYLAGWYYVAAVGAAYAIVRVIRRIRSKETWGLADAVPILLLVVPCIVMVVFPKFDRWLINRRIYDDKANWRVYTSVEDSPIQAILDGNPATYWKTPADVKPGEGFVLDFGNVRQVSQVRLNLRDVAEYCFPPMIQVFAYNEATGQMEPVTKLRTGRQNHIWIIYLDDLECRRLGISAIRGGRAPWVVYECDVLK